MTKRNGLMKELRVSGRESGQIMRGNEDWLIILVEGMPLSSTSQCILADTVEKL